MLETGFYIWHSLILNSGLKPEEKLEQKGREGFWCCGGFRAQIVILAWNTSNRPKHPWHSVKDGIACKLKNSKGESLHVCFINWGMNKAIRIAFNLWKNARLDGWLGVSHLATYSGLQSLAYMPLFSFLKILSTKPHLFCPILEHFSFSFLCCRPGCQTQFQ